MTGPHRIIDAHHHLWDLTENRYPGLQGELEDPNDPFGKGMLQRNYLVADYLHDVSAYGVVSAVHVEAAHDPSDPVRETAWLQSQADRFGFPQAIIAKVNLEDDALEALLDAHLEHPNVRGVRQMLDWQNGAQRPSKLLTDKCWLRGLEKLVERDLSFDLQVVPEQLAEAAEVAAAFPDLQFVLNHGGLHVPFAPRRYETWLDGLRTIARGQNVAVKVSGYDAVDPTWDPDLSRAFIANCVGAFGPDRSMFATNFPVDGRTTNFVSLVARSMEALQHLPAGDIDAYFYRTAARVYRLPVPDADTASCPNQCTP